MRRTATLVSKQLLGAVWEIITSVCGMLNVRLARLVQNLSVGIFLDTVNVINVTLCTVVVLNELYPFVPLSGCDKAH